jgi:hypothetical protein
MPESTRVTGSSFESFAEAAATAFEQVPGDPAREGVAAAYVTALWMTKGGIVGRPQYNAELVPATPGEGE